MPQTRTHLQLVHTGRVRRVIDHGSIVVVVIKEGHRLRRVAADGNAWKRYGASDNIHIGNAVVFTLTDWGALASIAPVEAKSDD